MPVWRLQAAAYADTVFPKDQLIITPHFNDQGVGTDPQGLCEDLAAGLQTYYVGVREIRVKAYDAEGTPPVYPQGDAVVNEGMAPGSTFNREVALCLSYYSGNNRPRQRGRLYVPCAVAGITPSAARPSTTAMEKVAALVPILTGLGGADVDWCVFSRVDGQARSVSNWWVDNAWDIQRSRGLEATTRITGTVDE